MKKAEIFFDAITNIREELIEAALDHPLHKKASPWRRYMAVAACLALMVTVGFGALQLGLFGGMGGSDSASSDAGFNGSVEDSLAPGISNTETDAGGNAAVDGSDDCYDDSSSPFQFGAIVLSVQETYLLVEPLEGESIRNSADRIMVSIVGEAGLPELEKGDMVTVVYNGMILESYPAQVRATRITKIPTAE